MAIQLNQIAPLGAAVPVNGVLPINSKETLITTDDGHVYLKAGQFIKHDDPTYGDYPLATKSRPIKPWLGASLREYEDEDFISISDMNVPDHLNYMAYNPNTGKFWARGSDTEIYEFEGTTAKFTGKSLPIYSGSGQSGSALGLAYNSVTDSFWMLVNDGYNDNTNTDSMDTLLREMNIYGEWTNNYYNLTPAIGTTDCRGVCWDSTGDYFYVVQYYSTSDCRLYKFNSLGEMVGNYYQSVSTDYSMVDCEYYNGKIYACGTQNHRILVIDAATLTLDSYVEFDDATGYTVPHGIIHNGSNFWIYSHSNYMTQWTSALGYTGITRRRGEFDFRGWTWDGTYYWGCELTTDTVRQYDANGDFTGFSFSTLPETNPMGIAYDGDDNLLWVTGTTVDRIMAYDPTTGLFTGRTIYTDQTDPYGLAYHDGLFYQVWPGSNCVVIDKAGRINRSIDWYQTWTDFADHGRDASWQGVTVDDDYIYISGYNWDQITVWSKYDTMFRDPIATIFVDPILRSHDPGALFHKDGRVFVAMNQTTVMRNILAPLSIGIMGSHDPKLGVPNYVRIK